MTLRTSSVGLCVALVVALPWGARAEVIPCTEAALHAKIAELNANCSGDKTITFACSGTPTTIPIKAGSAGGDKTNRIIRCSGVTIDGGSKHSLKFEMSPRCDHGLSRGDCTEVEGADYLFAVRDASDVTFRNFTYEAFWEGIHADSGAARVTVENTIGIRGCDDLFSNNSGQRGGHIFRNNIAREGCDKCIQIKGTHAADRDSRTPGDWDYYDVQVLNNEFQSCNTPIAFDATARHLVVGNTFNVGNDDADYRCNVGVGVGYDEQGSDLGAQPIVYWDNNVLEGCKQGMMVYGQSVITNSVFRKMKTRAVAVNRNGKVSFEHNVFENNGGLLSGSATYWSYGGVAVQGSTSEVDLGGGAVVIDGQVHSSSGGNSFLGNLFGAYCEGTLDACHIDAHCGGGSGSCVYSPFPADVANNTTSLIKAENNWWGDPDPSDQIVENPGGIDYTPALSSAPDGDSSETTYEAESFALSSYRTESNSNFSNGEGIRISSPNTTGSATAPFTGPGGTYEVELYYVIESDGQPSMELSIGSTLIDSFTFALETPADPSALKTKTYDSVRISSGDVIRLVGTRDSGAWARVDKLVFRLVDGAENEPECTTKTDCDDQDACNGAELCVSGTCVSGDPLECPSSTQCTVDGCDAVEGCRSVPVQDGTTCDDGDPGTVDDTCRAGLCAGQTPGCLSDADCSDDDACTGQERCVGGSCVAGSPLQCPPSTPCTASVCDAAEGCQSVPVQNGAACDDGDSRTDNDACHSGLCVGESSSATLTGLTANLPAPQTVGTPVTFTAAASAGGGPVEYRWWVKDGGAWEMGQDWSPSTTFVWTPTRPNRAARIGVWARAVGDTEHDNGSLPFPIEAAPSDTQPAGAVQITSLTADLRAPQPAGTSITFTTTASGGEPPLEYRWWIQQGGAWTTVRDWSTSSTFVWTPAQASPKYRIGVWVRGAGDATHDAAAISFAIEPAPAETDPSGPAELTSLTANLPAPQTVGTSITFTAVANGGGATLEYRWWVQKAGSWIMARDWSAASSFAWTPDVPDPSYKVGVWVRATGQEEYDVGSLPFPIEASVPVVVCGDGVCEGSEDCATCAADCGVCPPECGDGACEGSEDCATCAADCGVCPPECGDGACEGSEDCDTCAADCGVCPPECGDGSCDESEDCDACPADCGACPVDELPTPEAGVACELASALVFPNFVPFGKQLVGSTSEPQQVTIRNDGAQPFDITGISIDGPFQATGLNGRQELAPGETLDLSIRFQPASENIFEGMLTVSFDGLDSRQVQLLGYGRNDIPIVPLSSCGILDQEGATYVLQNDVTSPGTCFSIQDDFITLDLNGYRATYATAPSEHRHFGVLAAECWFIYIGDNPCGGSARGLVVKNGTIEQGSGAAPYSHGVAVQSINNTSEITVAYTTIIVSAKSSINIKIDYKTPLHIHHNTLISNVTEIFNRHQVEGALAKLTNGSIHRVHDNVLRGGPQGGIQSTASDSQIYRNDISQNGHYTNDFSIYAWGDRMEVFDNYVHPISGRGIQLDYADNIRVHHNVVEVKELPHNEEYGGCQLSGAYGIQVEGSTANNVVYANDVLALADECDGKAFRATGVDAGTNNLICNNTFRGKRVGNTDAIAAATSLGSVGGGVILLDNTLIADSMHIHDYWSDAANVLYKGNIFRKGDNPAPSYVTLFFDNNRPISNILIEDGIFENGASHTQAMMRQVGSPSWAGPTEYYVAWTLQLTVLGAQGSPKPGTDVTIEDATGTQVFSGTTDSNGRIETSLFQYRAFNSTSAPYNQEVMTPHLVTVTDGHVVTESIVMDSPRELTLGLSSISCGNGACEGSENCASCETDCGLCPPECGDGVCNGSESCAACPLDCGICPPVCGNGACEGFEDCATCEADCGVCPPECGDGACEGTEDCAACPQDCGVCPPVCGDGTCETPEDCDTCEMDCGVCPPECGDDACDESEDCDACPADCGTCPVDELPTPEAGDGCELTHALVFPELLPFGKQLVGSTGEPQQVTIRNDGAQPFHVTGISVEGPFQATGLNGRQELAPGETLELSVRFQPASENVFEGTLTVSFQGLDSREVRLLGYGRDEIPIVPLSSCGILDHEGATYVLQNDVSSPGTCFSIQNNFITLDLNGHRATYATAPSEHRRFGVLGAACWWMYLGDNPCGGSGRGLVVKNGTIEQGSGAAPYSHGVSIQSLNNTSEITVADTTIIVSAKASININIDYKSDLHIHHNTLISNVTEIFNRHQIEGVLLDLSHGERHRIHDNVLRGGPQGGMHLSSTDTQAYRNDISQNGHYTNDFSIYAWGDWMEVFDNYVHPVSGRGIQLDYADNIRVHHNVVEVKELPNNEEYSGCQMSGAYGIQVESSTANNLVYANDVVAFADECDGKAFRATGVDAGTNNLICNNVFRGKRVGNTDAMAAATSFGEVTGGVVLVGNTLISDTAHIHAYWEGVEDVLFSRNIFRKGDNPDPSFVTFFFDTKRTVANIVIEDGVFENGSSHTQAMMRQVGSPSWAGPSEYYVAWTLRLTVVGPQRNPRPGADVTINDATGTQVFSGTTDEDGRIEASLFEYRAFNSTSAPYNEQVLTPHLVTVTDGRTVTESVVMDAPRELTVTLE